MQRILFCVCLIVAYQYLTAQPELHSLTVEKIMRDPKWIGTSPSSPQWSADGSTLYFSWNPMKSDADSIYFIDKTHPKPARAAASQELEFVPADAASYTRDRKRYTWTRNGDVYFFDPRNRTTKQVTSTIDVESNPVFSFGETCIVYNRSQNLYSWNIATGVTVQLTNFKAGDEATRTRSNEDVSRGSRAGEDSRNALAAKTSGGRTQEDRLKTDQLSQLEVLSERKAKRDRADSMEKINKPKELRTIALDDRSLQRLAVNADGRFISYQLVKQPAGNRSSIVPNFVTESGFTTDIPARTKVGAAPGVSTLYIFDRARDTVYTIKTDSLDGIRDVPAYLDDYPQRLADLKQKKTDRGVSFMTPQWSPSGNLALIDIRAIDHKDRWLMAWDTATRKLKFINRQHDDAWTGGPGNFNATGWIDDRHCWFISEETGYAHLYVVDIMTGSKRAITQGKYEVQKARLSNDHASFYISTNQVHPGEQQFYKLDIASGTQQRLTFLTGAHDVDLSPDERTMAVLYSNTTSPWELYTQPVTGVSGHERLHPIFLTSLAASKEFRLYPWRDAEVITIPASDGQMVYARIYKPADAKPGAPAVLFVHGAGYLQDAHRWWSSYFREYMFNNLLADSGYYVLDIDYRGSAGYGRDWRTGIYRHMGGRDLDDEVDAAHWLVSTYGVDSSRIGMYGGSYGGFMTLMAMFTRPGTFIAGAALRPVTDWAQYNHPYTSEILNEPVNDSIAYRRSSPWYFADGLKGHLLICHGMVDVNVHYQDAVKLTQRLIELGKDNWELASYPMEDHGFVEPSSWTDEYKRIFRLFQAELRKPR